jgi:hypothetical protein
MLSDILASSKPELRNELTCIGDDNIQPTRSPLDFIHSGAIVLFVRRGKLDDVELSWVHLCELLEVGSAGRISRAGKYNDILSLKKCLHKAKPWLSLSQRSVEKVTKIPYQGRDWRLK